MIGSFFAWWFGELRTLLPVFLRPKRRHRGHLLRFEASATELSARQVIDGKEDNLGRFDIPLTGSDREELEAGLLALRPEETVCEVAVAAPMTLVREVVLPLAAEENLSQVLGFEMERRTPFKLADVHYDYAVLERDTDAQQLRVQMQVVPKRALEAIFQSLSDWQLGLVQNKRERVEGDRPLTLRFQSDVYRRRNVTFLNTALVALNLLLIGALVAVPITRQKEQLEELRSQATVSKRGATAALAVEEQLDRVRNQVQFLSDLKTRQPAVVELLEELTARLPDNTWLFRLELKKGAAHLQGSSEAASTLIATLEESAYFEKVNFVSPVVREGNTGRERFNISATVISKGEGEAKTAKKKTTRARTVEG